MKASEIDRDSTIGELWRPKQRRGRLKTDANATFGACEGGKARTSLSAQDHFAFLVRSTSSRISHFERRDTISVAVLRTMRSPRRMKMAQKRITAWTSQ